MPRERKTEVYTMRMTKDVKKFAKRNKDTPEKVHDFLEKEMKKEQKLIKKENATRTNTRKTANT